LGCNGEKNKGLRNYWYARVADRLRKQSEVSSETTLTQLREENCTERKKKLGLGVSPSQRSVVHTFGRKHSFIACIVLHELSLK
jgi:hypothetical protein